MKFVKSFSIQTCYQLFQLSSLFPVINLTVPKIQFLENWLAIIPTDRQTDRQRDRETETKRHREKERNMRAIE